jgi:PleD family two-component response regulator
MPREKQKKATALKKVLIVDDHAIVRSAITDMLEKTGRYEIFPAENGFEAMAYTNE